MRTALAQGASLTQGPINTLDQKTKQLLSHGAFYIGLAIALYIGGMLRLPDLDLRPMHVDEAIQAARFGQLLVKDTVANTPCGQ